MPRPRQIDYDLLRVLWADRSNTIAVLAARFGVSPASISEAARRLDLPPRRRTRNREGAPVDPHGLTGGEWVRDPERGVMVWRKAGG